MNPEDDAVDCKDADPKEKILDHICGNRRGVDAGVISMNREGLRVGAEMIIEAFGHKIYRGR